MTRFDCSHTHTLSLSLSLTHTKWGRSFWLKNSKEWKENSLTLDVDSKGEEETVIKEPRILAANGEQKDTFLPYEYYGKFYSNKKHCANGVVTLKDGTEESRPLGS